MLRQPALHMTGLMDTHRSRRQRRSNQEVQRSPLFPVPAVGPSLPQGPMVALPSFTESPRSPAGAFVWARVGRTIPNQNSCCGHAGSMARPYLPTRRRKRLPLSGPRRPRPSCETPWRASPLPPKAMAHLSLLTRSPRPPTTGASFCATLPKVHAPAMPPPSSMFTSYSTATRSPLWPAAARPARCAPHRDGQDETLSLLPP